MEDLWQRRLVEEAKRACQRAYAPYSDFCVGACILDARGNIYTGCNIENVSFSATCCAERVAIYSAIAAGAKQFVALAIASNGKNTIFPCGVCRQVLQEFCAPDMLILCAGAKDRVERYTLGELLPRAFDHFDPQRLK